MPTKLPEITKSQVIQQWLSGDQRDKIAADNGLSAGAVTNIINEWRQALGFSAAEQLRDLVVALKKIGLTPTQCATGFRVRMLMNRLGIEEDDIQSFLSDIYNHCKNLGITPESIASHLTDLLELSKKVPFSQISDYMQQKLNEKNNLEQEIERLNDRKRSLISRISELKLQHNAALEEKNITDEILRWYSNLKAELSTYGIDVEDAAQLTKAIKGAKDLGYNPVSFTKEISNLEELRNQYQSYQYWIPIVKGQLDSLKQDCSIVEQTLQSHNQTLSTYHELAAMGLGLKELKILLHTISEILNANNISLDDAVQKFLKDVEDNYDDCLGFQSKIKNLRYETERVTLQLNSQRIQLSLYPSVGPVLQSLIQKGVKEEEIVAFAELLRGQSTSNHNIYFLNGRSVIDDVRRYGDIKSTLDHMSQQSDNLKIELRSLETQKLELQSNNQNLTLRFENLKRIVDFFNGSINSLATEIMRLFCVIAYANMFLLKTHYEGSDTKENESKIDVFTPLIKSARGEAVRMSELKKALSKAIEAFLTKINENENENDTGKYKIFYNVLIMLKDESNSTN